LAVSNIPFGDIAVFDAEFQRSDSFGRRSAQNAIHNYFFLKGLDTVRDGGIVAFITSQGVLNSTKTSVRNDFSGRLIWYPRYACPTTCSRTTRARRWAVT